VKPPPALAFAIKFALFFALLMGAFEASRGSAFERFLVETCILEPTTYLLNALGSEHAQLAGRTLSMTGANLRVTRGCEGVEMFLILVAGILSYPASGLRRAQGLLIGGALAYVLAVARLMALLFILRYSPAAWQALHGLILPLAPIVLIAMYFMIWSGQARQTALVQYEPNEA
jgi:exosortase/archaeosortase family protein